MLPEVGLLLPRLNPSSLHAYKRKKVLKINLGMMSNLE